MKFTICQASHQGPRKYNQDRIAYSYSRDAMLAVLADGMGGHSHGEVAAEIAISTLTDAFQNSASPMLANPKQFLEESILKAHDAIEHHALVKKLADHPRTTVVAAVAQQNSLYVAHVGDSRLYHIRNGRLVSRTEDHSKVQMLFRRGLIDHGQMALHPERNKIYNCLGGDIIPKVELSAKHKLLEGDTIMLCSDGLWSLIGDEKIAEILSAHTVETSVPALLELAESRSDKNSDNMSAIAFNWGGFVFGKRSISTATMPLDAVTTILMNPRKTEEPDEEEDTTSEIDLSDDAIEGAIAEIQAAIKRLNK